MWGTSAAAWPLIRHDLHLSYAEIGLVLAVPGFVGSALDPLIGAAGDTARRRPLMFFGGLAFALSAGATAGAIGFWTLLAAFVLGNPASGAFVSLAQATLMDLEPDARERNMARWTLAGSFGYVAGPVVIAAAVWLGADWRAVVGALAVVTVPLALATRRVPDPADVDGRTLGQSLRHSLGALRRREVVRWLVLLLAADLLLDIFHGFLALYLVDVAGVGAVTAALGVGVWTGAGLVGDWLLLLVLRRIEGSRYLRWSAAAALVAYPAFLVVPGTAAKLALAAVLGLLNSGWYAIPKAGLYAALPGRSGVAVAAGGVGGLAAAAVPLALGFLAGGVGLGATMWILVLAPAALLALSPRAASLKT